LGRALLDLFLDPFFPITWSANHSFAAHLRIDLHPALMHPMMADIEKALGVYC
jgi:hypothetical protein